MTKDPHDQRHDDPKAGFIGLARQIAEGADETGASVGEMVDQLDERAFGILILFLSIPCLVPGLPGAQIIAIPIFLLTVQIVIGRHEPWLPGWFMRARVKRDWLQAIAGFMEKRLGWTERLARPRLGFLASGLGERLAAAAMALAAVTIMLPITNTIPSLALTLAAVGLIQRDGLFVLAGTAVALGWVAVLGAVIFGLATGAGFALEFVSERAPWMLEWLGREGG